jgi:hypothetical protein
MTSWLFRFAMKYVPSARAAGVLAGRGAELDAADGEGVALTVGVGADEGPGAVAVVGTVIGVGVPLPPNCGCWT